MSFLQPDFKKKHIFIYIVRGRERKRERERERKREKESIGNIWWSLVIEIYISKINQAVNNYKILDFDRRIQNQILGVVKLGRKVF